eukprot:361885-Chlamydomonas_euryale.AAC.11
MPCNAVRVNPTQSSAGAGMHRVHFNGMRYKIRVKPGPEGLASFQRQLHRITGLPQLDCMQITFQCRAPGTSQELSFSGISAFDAAIHCAAISAAERQHKQPDTPQANRETRRDCPTSNRDNASPSSASTDRADQMDSPMAMQGAVLGSMPSDESSASHVDAGASVQPRASMSKRMPRLRAFQEFFKALFA